MSISRILSACPDLQVPLGEAFIEVGQRESLPYLEYLVSPENSKMIRQMVAPGRGKLRTVETRWIQRLPESIVEEGSDINTCTATEEYGDSTTTYSLSVDDTYQVNQLITGSEIAEHCQDNDRYIYESINRLLVALDNKLATVAATQTAAYYGGWGTEVADFYTVSSDKLQLATRTDTTGVELNWGTLGDIQQAAKMANYPSAPIAFGGAELNRYLTAVKGAGCCSQYGIDLMAVAMEQGIAFAYDQRLATALGGQLYNLITAPGAIQWLSYNLAGWNGIAEVQRGSNYVKQMVFTPSGVPVDLNIKDDCGALSIVITATGKIVTLPDDIYEASDKYAGINYANVLQIVNPS